MKRIEIADTVGSATNFEMEGGRIVRIHMKLVTPESQLAESDYIEVETRGFEITKNGSFVVDDDGIPVSIAPQRARIPMANVRSGLDSVKPNWIKQTLPEDKDDRAAALDPHKKLKALPKTAEAGDIVRVGDEVFAYTDGLYEAVRRSRLAEFKQAAPLPKLDAAAVADLTP